jgi:hypothetical protein
MALYLALNREQNNWLLWVTDDGRPGSVEMVAPRFMRGHVSRFMRPDVSDDFMLTEWVRVLSGAWRLGAGKIAEPRGAPRRDIDLVCRMASATSGDPMSAAEWWRPGDL